jgi:sec-independent protein translocase protein TatA
MGIGSIGATGFLLIVIVALLLFGPSKLPELGRAFGKTLREFKKGTREIIEDEEDLKDQDQPRRKEINAQGHDADKPQDNHRLPD